MLLNFLSLGSGILSSIIKVNKTDSWKNCSIDDVLPTIYHTVYMTINNVSSVI